MSGDCRLSSPMARALLVAAPTTQHSPSSPNFLAALHLCLASPLPRHLPLRRRSQPMAVLRRNSTERVSSALLPAKPSPLELMEQNERDSLQLVYDFCQCWLTKSAQRSVATFLLFLQLSLPLPLIDWDLWLSPPADAVLYSPNTKVPRTGELALRRAIPANANMKAIQESLEDISYLLRIPQKKPYGTMEADVKKSLKILQEGKDSILGGMPAGNKEKGSELYSSLLDGKGGLQELIRFIKEQNADKVSVGLSNSLDTVAELELLQASGLSFLLPDDYLKYPRLTGRGIVEFTIEKADGSTFFPASGGEPKSMATIQVVVDGYSAPLTAGNFAKLVIDGAYDGVKLKCTSQAVLSDNEVEGKGYRVPLEVMPSGQFEPLYKTTLSIQDGELPVLPLSVYGAVAMAHSAASEEYSSPSQFFFYLGRVCQIEKPSRSAEICRLAPSTCRASFLTSSPSLPVSQASCSGHRRSTFLYVCVTWQRNRERRSFCFRRTEDSTGDIIRSRVRERPCLFFTDAAPRYIYRESRGDSDC